MQNQRVKNAVEFLRNFLEAEIGVFTMVERNDDDVTLITDYETYRAYLPKSDSPYTDLMFYKDFA